MGAQRSSENATPRLGKKKKILNEKSLEELNFFFHLLRVKDTKTVNSVQKH